MSKRNIIIIVAVASFAVLVLWLSVIVLIISSTNKPVARTALSEKDRASLEASRDKMCKTSRELVTQGAFTKIEPGTADVTHVYVDHAFYALTVDQKRTALGTVAGCYINLDKKNQLGLVIIKDGYSGKQIGTYSMALGLDLD